MKNNKKIVLVLAAIISLFISSLVSADMCANCGGCCNYNNGCGSWANIWTGGYVGFGPGNTACPMCENTCGSCEATYRSCTKACAYDQPTCPCNYGDYSY